jgi:hypothetical protein
MKTAVDQLIEKMSLEDVCKYSNELAEAKEMEKIERINLSDESYSLGLKHGKQMYRGGFDGSDGPILK